MDMKDAAAARIKSICAAKGISISALAGKAGLPPSTVYGIANGRSGNPGIASIARICTALGMDLRSFFDSDLFSNIKKHTDCNPMFEGGTEPCCRLPHQ